MRMIESRNPIQPNSCLALVVRRSVRSRSVASRFGVAVLTAVVLGSAGWPCELSAAMSHAAARNAANAPISKDPVDNDGAAAKPDLAPAGEPAVNAADANGGNGNAPNGDIPTLISQLEADEFDTREKATQQLMQLGPKAIPELLAAAKIKSLEVGARCISVFKHLAKDKNAETAKAARDALQELVSGQNKALSRRATAALDALVDDAESNDGQAGPMIPRGLREAMQTQRSTQVTNINGKITRTTTFNDGDKKIKIVTGDGRGISVSITETDDKGKSKTTEYKAKNAEELEKDHPEAAEIYKKYEREMATAENFRKEFQAEFEAQMKQLGIDPRALPPGALPFGPDGLPDGFPDGLFPRELLPRGEFPQDFFGPNGFAPGRGGAGGGDAQPQPPMPPQRPFRQRGQFRGGRNRGFPRKRPPMAGAPRAAEIVEKDLASAKSELATARESLTAASEKPNLPAAQLIAAASTVRKAKERVDELEAELQAANEALENAAKATADKPAENAAEKPADDNAGKNPSNADGNRRK